MVNVSVLLVAVNCNGWLMTTLVSLPANTVTMGITVIVMVSLIALRQPVILLTVKMYWVVLVGPAVGVSVLALIKLAVGDHEKELPLILPVSWVLLPKQTAEIGRAHV